MTRRICFALDLVDDAAMIAAYQAAHAPGTTRPEVTAAIRAKGFVAMEIWRTGDRLLMVAEVEDDWPRPIPASLAEADARWEAEMDRFQKPLASADGGKWVAMDRIFSLD